MPIRLFRAQAAFAASAVAGTIVNADVTQSEIDGVLPPGGGELEIIGLWIEADTAGDDVSLEAVRIGSTKDDGPLVSALPKSARTLKPSKVTDRLKPSEGGVTGPHLASSYGLRVQLVGSNAAAATRTLDLTVKVLNAERVGSVPIPTDIPVPPGGPAAWIHGALRQGIIPPVNPRG